MYEWKQGETVLGYGVTQNLQGRIEEHEREVPGSEVRVVATRKTETAARKLGCEKIKSYERENGDLPPKNKPR